MAEVDARIALGLQPVKINDPMETYAKGLQLKSLIDSGQLSKLQYDQAVKNAALDEGINNAYKNAYGADGAVDRNKLYAGVAQAGGGSKLPAIQKGFAEADKIGYESQVEKMKVAKQKTEQLGSLAGSALEMIKSGNINQVASVYGQAVNRGLMTAEEARQEMGQLNWGDPNSLMRHFGSVQMRAVDALKQIELNTPKIEYRNTGKQQVPIDINARTNPNPLPLNNTTTPDSDQSAATARRGQDLVNARAAQSLAQSKDQASSAVTYQQDQNGNLVALPTKVGAGQITPRIVIGADGKPVQGNKSLTEYQGKSTGFALRAREAQDVINNTSPDGKIQPGLIKRIGEAVPYAGEGIGTVLNVTQSADQQKIEQAQRNFVNAILRQESGAAINKSEFDNAKKQYFPQPGDSKEVILQKKQNRESVIQSLEIGSGPGIKNTKNNETKPGQSFSKNGITFLGFE